jgi:hypothetical protein
LRPLRLEAVRFVRDVPDTTQRVFPLLPEVRRAGSGRQLTANDIKPRRHEEHGGAAVIFRRR